MLATLADALPQGADWLFEPKWDGYRALAYVREGEVELRSRRDNDSRSVSPRCAGDSAGGAQPELRPHGEVCALDDAGKSSFSLMQQGKAGSSTTSSTCWRSTASPSSGGRSRSAGAARRSARSPLADGPDLGDVRDGERCSRRHDGRAWRA